MADRPHPIVRLTRQARAHRGRMAAATTFSVLNRVVDLAPPLLIGAAIDIVVEGESSIVSWSGVESTTALLWVLAGVTLAVWGAESVFEYVHAVQWRNLAQTVQHELRVDAYDHMQHLELSYFEDRGTGDLMAILNDDVNQLERFLDRGANDLIQTLTSVVTIGVAFAIIAPGVAWLAFVPIPVIVAGSLRFQARIAPRYASVREQAGLLNGQLNNNISGIATVKSFTSEDIETARITDYSEDYRTRNRSAIRLSSAFSPIIRMAIVVGFTATLVYGGVLAANGDMSVGSYGVMVFLTQRLLWPLTRLGETVDLYHRAMASTNRILDVLDTDPTIVPGSVALDRVDGAVRFEDVSFAYHRDAPVLEGLDLEIPAGDTIAIVGATGAGKSTVIKLLLRFYDPTGGRITLDGHDLRELDFATLRGAVGLVSQDVFLFHGTVRENIEYGRPGASLEEVVAAAELAEAHEFVTTLPEGYATIVGERGQKLSGGQRQRISIARAILKDPAILVLDEATSSVDNETEAAIQRSLVRVSEDRTTIVIAHRLSTIRDADTIYVLEDGRLVEQGAHEDLLEAEGLYAGLWAVQTGAASRRTRHRRSVAPGGDHPG
ncbi:MAG: ABC transporter ATP-binding protein [Acidimicrobiia bacterium]|nr:ABC transporter ATP-binding protein [Acidimicrobiia bacterium]